jgi:hypothetical protein
MFGTSEMKQKPKTKGHLFWKFEWYHLCSRHQGYNAECRLCQKGEWVSVGLLKISGIVYQLFPKIWRAWVNRHKGKDAKFDVQKGN